MPRPRLPPTPASSTDIKGQDGSKNLNSLQLSFELPPPAIVQDTSKISSEDIRTSHNTKARTILPSKTAPYPVQPSETVKSRRRSSAAQRASSNESFALPPPPTRSRKIIQMKPRSVQEEPEKAPTTTSANSGASGPRKTGSTTVTQSKKKQPSTTAMTSAAGRKIARKTAHSLIERRRRSKMNEEFAVLKGMIPACTGEMHKLAILQASIEYVRYLEDCIAKLKAQRDASEARSPTESGLQTPAGRSESWGPIPQFVPGYQEDPDDVEMTDSEAPSPTFPPPVSPALLPQDASSRHRHDSYSSVSTNHPRQCNYSTSTTTSPTFGPQPYVGYGHSGGLGSALTSPALAPQRDPDQEATAALLMLNNDRRGTVEGTITGAVASAVRSAGRGMSVRDLLST
ncbi:helix-loop-helix DNA-binding domain-containing protein [Colletotrichum falcatum]|nr:helix-loop-helix DNA-binding domain-containing protein [Colletotrichum falcatum]